MHSTRKLIWAFVLVLPLLSATGLSAKLLNLPGSDPQRIQTADDYVPDVTDRVARFSLIRGDVRIRRADSQEWERAVLNLPLVAGDEIATDQSGRCEIQFDVYTHVRLAENSVLKVTTLRDGGIAVSVPQGSIAARLTKFDKDRGYFEIDAPETTIAIERSGAYRVDAGDQTGSEVRVTATQDGQARIYSNNAGVTLHNGRTVTLVISGSYAGEMQTADAERSRDEFDTWVQDREGVIAKRLRDAYYDKYYDRDIYGAEDLNDSGEWIYTRDYGYVWRPFPSAVSSYADWSPYRYGAWRWVAPYGWTWVGDEAWGWATYHYGRWVWTNGYWVWSPYGYYRYQRSWWEPALVVVSVYNNNVCWYPLPYNRHNRHNYNSHHGGGPRNNHTGGGQPAATPTPTPAAPGSYPLMTAEERRRKATMGQMTPPTAVVSVPASEFGRGRGAFRTPPLAVATQVINQSDTSDVPPALPTYKELGGRVGREILIEAPPVIGGVDRTVRTGAAVRKTDAPLDTELRTRRIFGDRAPLPDRRADEPVKPSGGSEPAEPRRTGVIQRQPVIRGRSDQETTVKETPSFPSRDRRRVEEPKRDDTPTYVPPQKDRTPPFVPPPVREERKYDPPVQREQPRFEPQPRQETPRNDPPPRYDPPAKSDPPPRSDPPAKSDPPPQKSDGPVDRKGKDGRR